MSGGQHPARPIMVELRGKTGWGTPRRKNNSYVCLSPSPPPHCCLGCCVPIPSTPHIRVTPSPSCVGQPLSKLPQNGRRAGLQEFRADFVWMRLMGWSWLDMIRTGKLLWSGIVSKFLQLTKTPSVGFPPYPIPYLLHVKIIFLMGLAL